MSDHSIVEYFAEHEGYRCGYCGNKDTNYSHGWPLLRYLLGFPMVCTYGLAVTVYFIFTGTKYNVPVRHYFSYTLAGGLAKVSSPARRGTYWFRGMWAHVMTVQDYQDLINRGWRRSGKYCYKPTMDKTCCPQYTIRCNALDFKLSKSQKKVIKKVHKYLNSGVRSNGDDSGSKASTSCDMHEITDKKPSDVNIEGLSFKKTAETCSTSVPTCISRDKKTSDGASTNCDSDVKMESSTNIEAVQSKKDESKKSSNSKKTPPKPGAGADPNRPQCKKAKVMRLEKRQQKLMKQGKAQAHPVDAKKQKHQEPKTIEDYLSEISDNPAHRLEIKLVRSSPESEEFRETFDEACQAFKKYQMTIHKESAEDSDEASFRNFLVMSPLKKEKGQGGFRPGFGSFHQQYWLDGKLIAVGVIDILPYCVSSVYLYYDPEYSFLSLGSYSALREVAFTRHVHSLEPSVQYYYMGFYIHSCPKMIYKGQYFPSFILCPETYIWKPIETCRPKMDANKYSRLEDDESKVDENGQIEVATVQVLHKRQAMPYMFYQAIQCDDDEEEVRQYAGFVGRTCAERMLLYRA